MGNGRQGSKFHNGGKNVSPSLWNVNSFSLRDGWRDEYCFPAENIPATMALKLPNSTYLL